MEIFKLFNDWPKSPEKEKPKIEKCDCGALSKQVEEKEEVIEELKRKIGEHENQMNESREFEDQAQMRIAHLEQCRKKIQDKLAEQNNEIANLKLERDKHQSEAEITSEYLKNVEFSFNDVHSKYERSKTIIEELKGNEIALRKCVEVHENTIALLIQQYEELKTYSIQQFENANVLVNKITQEREHTIAQLQSKIRKLEITTAALDQNLQQKAIENEQLSSICDELISKQHTFYMHNEVKDCVITK